MLYGEAEIGWILFWMKPCMEDPGRNRGLDVL